MVANLTELRQVGIEAFAKTLGYEKDVADSGKRVAVLRNDAGDKLLVTAGRKGHDIYRNERDHTDRGDIVDFVMNRLGLGFDEAREELARWAGISANSKPSFHPAYSAKCADIPRRISGGIDDEPERGKIAAVWDAAIWNSKHPYLISRGLPSWVLTDPRFADTFRQDAKGNALFLHQDQSGPCGYEYRNTGFKGFMSGGRRGLWFSRSLSKVSRIVICESPIDSLSFHALHHDQADALFPVGYVATGGTISGFQRELLKSLMRRCPGAIVAGLDNDKSGDAMCLELQELSKERIDRMCPIGKDWNEDLVFCNREQGGTSWN